MLGSSTLGLQTGTFCQISGSIRLEIKCIINVMHLDHPPSAIPIHRKIVFHEISAWALSRVSHVWLCDQIYYSPPGSSVHVILQTRILALPCPLQEIFPTQGLNLHLLWLLHCRWILYPWATGEGPPWNQSLVPKRLGVASLWDSLVPLHVPGTLVIFKLLKGIDPLLCLSANKSPLPGKSLFYSQSFSLPN